MHVVIHRAVFLRSAFLSLLLLCCGDLAHPPESSKKQDHPKPSMGFDPPLREGRAVPIVQLRLSNLSENVEPAPVVIEGIASDRNIQDLAKGSISASLQARILDVSVWVDSDGSRVIAPTHPLELGEKYSVVAPSIRWAMSFDVVDWDDVPVLFRVWPPENHGGRYLVWCTSLPATGKVLEEPQTLVLAPDVAGVMSPGAVGGMGKGCVRWQALGEGGIVMPPPELPVVEGEKARVDPSPISLQEEDWEEDADCSSEQIKMGPLCVEVFDDRAVLTSATPRLVGVDTGNQQVVGRVGPDEPWVVRSLSPNTSIGGEAFVLSPSGSEQKVEFVWSTSSPISRVVINEVMANPVGPEPDQEWVELFNDGAVDVDLSGWRFEDVGGSLELPPVPLPSGRYALIVGEKYDPESWVDVPPAPGTILLRVPTVGNRGLSNGGEPIRLVGPDGVSVSRVPAIASKKDGWSIVRLRPDAPDVLGSFGFDPDGGTPGAPNKWK